MYVNDGGNEYGVNNNSGSGIIVGFFYGRNRFSIVNK